MNNPYQQPDIDKNKNGIPDYMEPNVNVPVIQENKENKDNKENTNNTGNDTKSSTDSWIISAIICCSCIIAAILIGFTIVRYLLAYNALKTGNTAIGLAALSPEIGKGIGSIIH